MVIAAAETLQEIHKIGEYNAILSFILVASFIVLMVLGIQKALKAFGLTTKNDLYKKEQEERINRLADRVERIDKRTQSYEQRLDETVVTLRASLWRLHGEFVKQNFVTPASLKIFMEMGKIYEAAGGDDIYHEKLKPEVEALEIRYPDGSIYTKI